MTAPARQQADEPTPHPRRLAGLLEHLVPILDELARDLVAMNESTAIELDTWPAAAEFVDAWLQHR